MTSVLLEFFKYQGLGNDFVVVETDELMAASRAMKLCDRRCGIGADGVLSILPARRGGDAFMHIYNSDGSVAAMCGNGLRCVARHLAERRGRGPELVVETDGGVKKCIVHRDGNNRVQAVSVEMGPARWLGEETFLLDGERLLARRVSMGNPHAVFFGEATVALATRLGPRIEKAVPGGVNAGFASIRPGGLDLVVWERGAGLTDACGTGACAAAAAAVKIGFLRPGEVEVRLPGGVLTITTGSDLESVLMRGPAELAFEGRTELGA